MQQDRSILVLFQVAALVIVPLFLEISWSKQIFGLSPSAKDFLVESIPSVSVESLEESDLVSNNASRENHTNTIQTPDEPPSLQIAWLMSFPNSGTTYTSHFIRKTTGTRTATNYAELRLSRNVLLGLETKESIPVFADQPTGPFWNDGNETRPTSGFVLTKNHCGAPCLWCRPEQYTQMIHHFRHRCLRSDKLSVVNGTKTIDKVFYPPTRVAKAVHLVRDPLDNIVSRFRYERTNGRSALGFNSTKEDFRAYCSAMNKEFLSDMKRGRYVEPFVRKRIENIPCHAEIVKWVEWHNMAFIVTRELNLESMVLHYEDYSTRFENVTSELLTFLKQEAIEAPPVFHAFKEYKGYFTQEERETVAMAVRIMALRETWSHVSRYFR